MSNTKIVVLRSKEVITAAIFVGIAVIVLFVLLGFLFTGKNDSKTTAQSNGDQKYEAGVYTKEFGDNEEELTIGDSVVNLQLSLDEDRVKAVEFVNLSESVETMYPLMQPTVEKLSKQLAAGKTMEEIVVSEDTQYTEKILVETVSEMLKEHTKN